MILVTGAYKWPSRSYCHLMKQYIYDGKVNDNFLVINIRKMWEKLVLAARAIVAIDNPHDICVVGSRPDVQRAILKFAHHTGSVPIAGRFTPGSFTNQITKAFKEPRLIIVSDPKDDSQAIKEASYVNIPVIAFANPSSPISCVDIAIPCNMQAQYASGLMWWLLCREVLRLKGSISRETQWAVMVDLFIHREQEKKQGQQQAQLEAGVAPALSMTTQPAAFTGDDVISGQAPTSEFVASSSVYPSAPMGYVAPPGVTGAPAFLDEALDDGIWTNESDLTEGVWTSMTNEWTSSAARPQQQFPQAGQQQRPPYL